VVTNDDRTGRITAFASWPEGSRAALTEMFSRCLDELWACLDSLITKSVTLFSVRERLRDPERPRYFPMAGSTSAKDSSWLVRTRTPYLRRLDKHESGPASYSTLDGLRKEPSAVASYRKTVRLHLTPHIGALRLDKRGEVLEYLSASGRRLGDSGKALCEVCSTMRAAPRRCRDCARVRRLCVLRKQLFGRFENTRLPTCRWTVLAPVCRIWDRSASVAGCS
jgi:hypothetical protein